MDLPTCFLKIRRLSAITALLFLILLFTSPALSQEDMAPPVPRIPSGNIELRSSHLFEANLDNNQGKMAVTHARADFSYSRYSLGWQTSWYSWQDRTALPFGYGDQDPWSSLHALTFMVEQRDRISQRWSYFVQGAIRSGFEKELSRSVGVAANGGLIYAWDENWSVGLGGFIGVDPTSKFAFSSTFAMAGPFLQYRNPRAMGFSGRLGFPQSELRYVFNPTWSAWLGFGVNSGTYRLADDSTVMPKGYVREKMYTAGIYLDASPVPNLLLRLGPTYNFSRRLEFYDSSGDKRRSYDQDAALGMEATVNWTF